VDADEFVNLPELRRLSVPWWDWELSSASSCAAQYAPMVMERTREVGILKALGIFALRIVRMLLARCCAYFAGGASGSH